MAFLPADIAAALGISPSATTTAAPQGMTSDVVFVDDGGRALVLKHCGDPRYLDWLRREREVLVALSGSPLRVPHVISYHERSGEIWMLTTRLPGQSFWDVLQRSTLDERARHLRTLGAFVRELHATPAPAALRDPRPWMDRMLEQARHNLAWCDDLNAFFDGYGAPPIDDATRRWFEQAYDFF